MNFKSQKAFAAATVKKNLFGAKCGLIAASLGLITTSVFYAPTVAAQTSYYWGNAQLDDSVSVNLSVLDSLGSKPSLSELLSPRTSNQSNLYATPNTPTSSLVADNQSPQVNTSVNEASNSESSALPKSGLVTQNKAPAPTVTPPNAAPIVKAEEPKVASAPTPVSTKKPEPVETPAPVASNTTKDKTKPVAVATKQEAPAKPEPVAAPTPIVAPVAKKEVAAVPKPIEPPVAPKIEAKPKKTEVALKPKPVPAPAPAMAPAPKKEEQKTQTASLPKTSDPSVVTTTNDSVRILFGDIETDVPNGAMAALDEIVKMLQEDDNLSLQLEGFATIPNASPNQSRRMSLFRAISVRNYLVKHEIASRRIEVRALGSKTDSPETERVDVFIKKPN